MFPSTACTIVPGMTSTTTATSDVPERPLQRDAQHAGERRDDDDPAADAEQSRQQTRADADQRQRPCRHGSLFERSSSASGPRRIWIDCHARSTAVHEEQSRALTTSVSSAPTAEAAAPVSEIHAAARMSTSPARWYVNAPTVAVGRITGRGVATATMGGNPRERRQPRGHHDAATHAEQAREDACREADEHGEDRLRGVTVPIFHDRPRRWLERPET